MTLGIAIPTYIEHIEYLDRLLDSIKASTVKPDEVSICMSECVWIGDRYPFKIITSQFNGRRNVAQNLNVAISMLTTDLISVIGGDDMVHPQRNEFLLEVFKEEDVDAVVHDFMYGEDEDDMFWLDDYDSVDLRVGIINSIKEGIPYPVCEGEDIKFANGFITCRRNIFERFKYDESEDAEFIEDSLFNMNLVLNGINISYIAQELALYIKNPNRPPK